MSRGDECAYSVPATDHTPPVYGLTIREHFAAMAMQGILANPQSAENANDLGRKTFVAYVAEDAVAHADSLLAELERPR